MSKDKFDPDEAYKVHKETTWHGPMPPEPTISDTRIAEIRRINNDRSSATALHACCTDILAAIDAAHTNINIKADWIEKTINQLAEFEARALAAEAERDKLKAELEELDFLRHEGGPDSVAAIEAERDRLADEREQLALAICGDEDAPGFANAQTVEKLVEIAEQSRREPAQEYERAAGDRADAAAARKQVRRYRDALYRIAGGTNYADDPWDIARFALREDLP